MGRRNEITFKLVFVIFILSMLFFVLLAFRSCSLLTEAVEELRAERTAVMDILRPSR